MQIKQLEYFVAVSEYLSFTKAAKQFYITQTAISLQIKALEEELGVTLFYRTNRKVELTLAGKSFLEDAKAIIHQTKDACLRAKKAETKFTGHLEIGFVKGFEKTNITDLLSDFNSQYPNVTLSLKRENVSELYDAILFGNMDLCINILYSFDEMQNIEHIDYVPLKEYPLLALFPVSHPLSRRSYIKREELKGFPLVDIKKNENRYGEEKIIRDSFIQAGFIPDVAYTSDDIEISVAAVSVGLGYALLPSYITDALTMKDKIAAVPLEGEEHQIPIIVAWNRNNQNQILKEFLNKFMIPYIENNRF